MVLYPLRFLVSLNEAPQVKSQPIHKTHLFHLNVNYPIPHSGGYIDFGFISETKTILPLRLNPPIDGGHNAADPRNPEPVPLAGPLFLPRGTAGEPVSLALETRFEEEDLTLGVDLKGIPYIALGYGMKIP
jgi:hypothetical protein